MRSNTESGNVVSSHSSACGASSLIGEAADRLAQLLVLVGEDEVLAAGGEIRLEYVFGCHVRDRIDRGGQSKQ